MKKLNIPVGISDFAKIRDRKYYYVDKTKLISDLLEEETAEVTLITRPRRFGKTMAMSMLSHFFDIRKDSKAMFQGLKIAENTDLCDEWMNQWPVLFISFRRVDGLNFESAFGMLQETITDIYGDHLYLLDSPRISSYQKEIMDRILRKTASEEEIKASILLLTKLMQAHYSKPVILLIDEYDVPIAKASANGYYDEMLDVMKGILQALKDNDALRFAVITGCLRIAKESIFTGTNNFVSDTISSSHLNEYFGFTQEEVDQILSDADQTDHAEDVKAWYDGYHFGELDVYCPWDVMNYLRDLRKNPKTKPASYWRNTSDNAIIRSFIDYAGDAIHEKMETLLSGGYIIQEIREDLTYDYLHSSEENLWSILYSTGYLTQARGEELPLDMAALMIPNAEIRQIFETTVREWFKDNAMKENRTTLFDAVWSGDIETLTEEMNELLRKTISYHDYKEDFYHAFLAGIFTGAGYSVDSNRERGEGRSDVVVRNSSKGRVALFEAKYAKTLDGLEASCEAALRQIKDRQYAKDFADDYDDILCYGIAFYKKRCLVKKNNENHE